MPLQQQAQHRTLILFIEPRNRDQLPYLIKRRVRAFRSRSRSNPCSRLIFASPEEVARVERLIAREPAWRAEKDAARIARLMAQLGDPEARIEALLQREQAWPAAWSSATRARRPSTRSVAKPPGTGAPTSHQRENSGRCAPHSA